MVRKPLNSNDVHRHGWLLALIVGLLIGAASPSPVRAKTETIDLKALAKPFDVTELQRVVERALKAGQAVRGARQTQSVIGRQVGGFTGEQVA